MLKFFTTIRLLLCGGMVALLPAPVLASSYETELAICGAANGLLPGVFEIYDAQGSRLSTASIEPQAGGSGLYKVYTVERLRSKDGGSLTFQRMREGIEPVGYSPVRPMVEIALRESRCAIYWSDATGVNVRKNFLRRSTRWLSKQGIFSVGSEKKSEFFEVLRFRKIAQLEQVR
jgi:hypothetical protein